jgi:hypothetical protein
MNKTPLPIRYTHGHRSHFLRDFGRVFVASLAGAIAGALPGILLKDFSGAVPGVLFTVFFWFLTRALLPPPLLPCSSTDNAANRFATRTSGPFIHSGITALFGFSALRRPCHALYATWFDSDSGLGFSVSLGGRPRDFSTAAYERRYLGCLVAFPTSR